MAESNLVATGETPCRHHPDNVPEMTMENTTRMTLNLFAPAGACLLAAILLATAGSNLGANPLLAGVAEVWSGLVTAALLAAILFTVYGSVRLWQWKEGRTQDCPDCGGLLGREREGRFGPYRRCLGCGKNLARINYA